MRFPLAPNVATDSIGDALRLALPTRRILARRRIRKLAAADSHSARDRLLRTWSDEVVRALDIRVESRGREHVDASRPHLVVALHESLVDVPLLLSSLPLPMTFVARTELADEPPSAGLLAASRQILISPEASSSLRTVIRETALLAAQGRSVVMFPQGSVLGIETAFQPGTAAIAQKLDLPVLPVVIAGSHRVWEHPFSPLVRRGVRVYLEVLPPRHIEPDDWGGLEAAMKQRALANEWAEPRHFVPERDGYWPGYRFDIDPSYPELADAVAQWRRRASTGTAVRPSP